MEQNEMKSVAHGSASASGIDEAAAQEFFHDIIQAIVSAMEARDPVTAEHSLRVADMTERVCVLMQLPRWQTVQIHMAAHVHDIGKIAIPDSVLTKRARLTPEEHALMRSHVRIGAEILGSSPRLAGVADIVLHHHERWDGTGFPDGLAGESIPLGARIVTLCDSIDSMLGKHTVKDSMTPEECRADILENSGLMYDPAIAHFVLDHWDLIVAPIDFSKGIDKGTTALMRGGLQCSIPPIVAIKRVSA